MAKRVIEAGKTKLGLDLKRVYAYRSMLFNLAYRDLKVQYSQTFLGLLWSVIQPLTGLAIFTVFFDRLLEVDTGGIAYPLFAFSGMTAWYFFTYIVNHTGTSLVNAQHLIKKVYFPRLIVPFSKVLVGAVEFTISLALLLIMMLALGVLPDWRVLALPAFIALNILTGLSIGIWLAALTVRYRDFHHIIPYLINFGIWLTPVFYPATLIPERYHFLIYFNPMAGVIAGFRWSLLGDALPAAWFLASFIPVLLLFVGGLFYFKKIERKIVDII